MTNEEAIKHLSEYLDQAGMDVRLSPEDTAAIAMGIEALKKKYIVYADGRIEPEQKTGHWIEKTVVIDEFYNDEDTFYVCECCNESACQPHKYCPDCGAKLEGVIK